MGTFMPRWEPRPHAGWRVGDRLGWQSVWWPPGPGTAGLRTDIGDGTTRGRVLGRP